MLQELGLLQCDPDQMRRLRIRQLEVSPGQIDADVVGPGEDERHVRITIAVWTPEQWQRAVDALSSQALFAAQLLAGELPPQLDIALVDAGAPLLPDRPDAIRFHVGDRTESDHADRAYVETALRAVGGLLDDDPWLLFRLRGREQRQLLRHLRHQRTQNPSQPNDHGAREPHTEPHTQDTSFLRSPWGRDTELGQQMPHGHADLDLHNFWGNRKQLEEFRPTIGQPTVELVLLRRLGYPPFATGSIETYDALVEIYRDVTNMAIQLAYAGEAVDPNSATGRNP